VSPPPRRFHGTASTPGFFPGVPREACGHSAEGRETRLTELNNATLALRATQELSECEIRAAYQTAAVFSLAVFMKIDALAEKKRCRMKSESFLKSPLDRCETRNAISSIYRHGQRPS